MNELLKKVEKSVSIFKKIHTSNSTEYSDDYYEISAPTEFPNEEHNRAFREVQKLALSKFSGCSDEELSNEKSFISYMMTFFASRKDLELKRYLEILKNSSNYFKYLENLKKDFDWKGSYKTTFSLDKLNGFCSSIISDFMDPLDIKDNGEILYLYEEERSKFVKLDTEWQIKEYEDAFMGCDDLLKWYTGKWREKVFNEKFFIDTQGGKHIEEVLKFIISKCGVEKLNNSLGKIFKEFSIIRSKLGKDVPKYEEDKEWAKFDGVAEIEAKLYVRITIDLLKTIHNALMVLEKEREKRTSEDKKN
ncbi:MAG: hypothetical protein MRECE_41c011 [Mycoplasmataceae bacterium CE_OT135]|nr:MAG: hypothetical protein MRECE_41c011 [Mycoplasmataceae bacterium CE_OT135]